MFEPRHRPILRRAESRTQRSRHGLDLATPSIAFTVDDLEATRAALVGRGVQAADVGQHQGTPSFAFSDPEGRWFAVTQ